MIAFPYFVSAYLVAGWMIVELSMRRPGTGGSPAPLWVHVAAVILWSVLATLAAGIAVRAIVRRLHDGAWTSARRSAGSLRGHILRASLF